MPIIMLHHLCYTQLSPVTWCATAQVRPQLQSLVWSHLLQPLAPNILCLSSVRLYDFYWQHYPSQRTLSALKNATNKRQQQRSGVRLLLQNLLSKLGMTDTLDESQFPYRLVNSGYYVCFSHSRGSTLGNKLSNEMVAVAISRHRAMGIDIETQDVAWHVAQRFYHRNEIAILAELTIAERATISKYLWQLKESFIKIHQYKLAQGLGMDYTALIPDLIANTTQTSSSLRLIDDKKSNYQIAVLPVQQTVVVF